MAISASVTVLHRQLFLQRDGRDPLGVWAVRHGIIGDATGGGIKVGFRSDSPGRVYVCHGVTYAQLTGTAAGAAGDFLKVRLLTNHPDADVTPGVQGYATCRTFPVNSFAQFTAPLGGPEGQLISAAEKQILLFGPDPVNALVTFVELEATDNELAATYSFEGWGYYWDRGVLYEPGGPRFPGSD